MNALTQGLESIIKNAIEEYSKKISEKYNINEHDLIDIWNNVSNNLKLSASTSKLPVVSKTDIPNPDVNSCCPYIFIKGARQDEKCGGKVKIGNNYCSRHKKQEGVAQKDNKSVPVTKKQNNTSTSEKSTQPTIRMHRGLVKFWHPETCLVFKSKTEIVVIGSCINGSLVELTDESIELCKKWSFAFDKKYIEEVKEEEDVKDEEEVTEEVKEEEEVNEEVKEEVNEEEDVKEEDIESDCEDDEKKCIYMTLANSTNVDEKFWECMISGKMLSIKHGNIGTKGTVKNKEYNTHIDAVTEMDKNIRKKKKKGYKEYEDNKESDDEVVIELFSDCEGDDILIEEDQ